MTQPRTLHHTEALLVAKPMLFVPCHDTDPDRLAENSR